ncbi:MAG: HEAT repeat domain-containing protein [Planctomycetaceae bacterium]|nr:HEAT repeat domain-containing protein [Planctomycetaceae bacterium]
MLRCGLLLLLLLPQDSDLVEQLGDPDPKVREHAMSALAARGSAIRGELLQARRHRDPEVRGRALDLLCRFDPDLALERLIRLQRGTKLTFLPREGRELPPGTAVTDGARFWFSRRPWAPKGEVLGTVLETADEPRLEGFVQWTVASVRSKRDLPVETCATHSPLRVYVPGASPEQLVVTLKGTRHWRCEVPLEFKDPAEGDSQRLGGYTLTLKWPTIVVKADRPTLQTELTAALLTEEIQGELKPGRKRDRFGGRRTLVARSACGVRAVEDPAWCGCSGGPRPGSRAPLPTVQDAEVSTGLGSNPIDDYARISLLFHLPVEEAFEVSSPPLQ